MTSATTRTTSPVDLAERIYSHYEGIGQVRHYFGLLAIYGLARTAEAADSTALWERVEQILGDFPDGIDHPQYNFPSYTIGGIPQAFLTARGRMPHRAGAVVEYADEMMTAPRDPDGIVVMPRTAELNQIWIDSAMATTPYLVYAAQLTGDERYLDEAVHQTVSQYDVLLDTETGLLHQCKNFVGPGLLSADHWSRGNGWGHLALAELVDQLPLDHPRRDAVVDRFVALSMALLPHQGDRGLWRQEIPDPQAWEESSGTGLILYGFGIGLRHGLLGQPFRDAFDRGLAGLLEHAVDDDHAVLHSCNGCLCPGEGEEKGTVAAYLARAHPRDEPHGAGPIILALSEAHRLATDGSDRS